jgi:hypothetical protein
MEDPSTISPSAYALLKMKSTTGIPYAREAAALLESAASANLDSTADPVEYWTRVMHFESRYWSINQLLADQTPTNILEISSGFSFRGLDLSNKKPVYYIDTDLPNIITGKQKFIDAFTAESAAAASAAPLGHYELQPLNVLDPVAFEEVINKFPPGPLTIVNEGLLVYLDDNQKSQLCANIRKALLTRGGAWITADIYIKRKDPENEKSNAPWRQWSHKHQLEEKKFESFHAAEAFFKSQGFNVEKEATPDYSGLTSFSQFLKTAGEQALNELRRPGKPRLHATWRLTPAQLTLSM